MDIQDKILLNKKIKLYTGDNSFILSLQKQLKTSKYLQKIEVDGKFIKVFSDKQYDAAITILN